MTEPIVRLHSSGNFAASKGLVASALESFRERRAVCISMTETNSDEQIAAFREVPGWGEAAWRRDPAGNCSSTWDRSKFETIEKFTHQLAEARWFTRRGHQQWPVTATVAILKHKPTGVIYAPVVVHMPSHVDDFKGRQWEVLGGPANRVIAYQQALGGWRRLKRQIFKRYPGALIDLCWDTNLDHKKRVVRAFMKVQVGGMLTWQVEARARHGWKHLSGTHYSRLIDVSRLYWKRRFLRVRVESMRVLPRTAAVFDHNPFIQVIRVRRRVRR